MPRGVAIPEVRQQLFSAVERVIGRDGPGRLSGRAVTGEAGVATGLLYKHFDDFDDFLAGYAIDRGFAVGARAARLPEHSGCGSVAANLCDALLATPPQTVRTLTRLLAARPDLAGRVTAVLGAGNTGLDAIETAAAGYLAGEQRLGRVARSVDTEALACAVTALLHHLVLSPAEDDEIRQRVTRTVTALTDRVAAPASHG